MVSIETQAPVAPQRDPALDPGIKDPILNIESLSLWYGEKQALRDISLNIPDKKITAFIGPSGCGKSTLLRCINRLNDLIDGVRTEGEQAGKVGDVRGVHLSGQHLGGRRHGVADPHQVDVVEAGQRAGMPGPDAACPHEPHPDGHDGKVPS